MTENSSNDRSGFTKYGFRLLNSTNYDHWRQKMYFLLCKENLWEVTERPAPTEITESWTTRNRQAVSIIGLGIEDAQLKHIVGLTTAHEIWTTFEKIYSMVNVSSRHHLHRKFAQSKWTSGTIVEYIDHMQDLIFWIQRAGGEVRDEEFVCHLIGSMPESWETFISGLESSPPDLLTPDYVIQKLKSEYERRQDRKETVHTTASEMAATASKSNKQAANKINKWKTADNNRKQETRTCYNCGKRGHLANKCRAPKKEKADSVFHAVIRNEGSLRVETKTSRTDAKIWCLDSGATKNMTNNRSFYTSFKKLNNVMSNADGHHAKVAEIGSGTISHRLKFRETRILQLNDVLYVPTLVENLISVSRALKSNLAVHFEDKFATIVKKEDENTQVLIEAHLDAEGLFKFQALSNQDTAHIVRATCSLRKWHRRFGHRDPAAIRKLASKKLVIGLETQLSDDCDEICECCIKGKLATKSFPRSESTTEKPLEIIHSDLCGPLPITSAGGNRYILTFIDDYSRYTVIKLLKRKNEVMDAVKDYINCMKTYFERDIKILRTDNGREYINRELQSFLKERSIKHQFTVAYTPQQNGVAERKNRSLIEMARCLLIDAKMDKKYWSEAVLWATYLQNRLPTACIDKTPYELFKGKKPDVSHLRVFGAKVYSLVPRRHKLNNKTIEGILIGYGDNVKGYRILDTKTDRVWYSHTVKIVEDPVEEQIVKKEPEGEWHPFTEDDDEDDYSSPTEIEPPVSPITISDDEDDDESTVYDTPSEEDDNNEETPFNELRRSKRTTAGKPPKRFGDIGNQVSTVNAEPSDWEEVQQLPHKQRELWKKAAEQEMKLLHKHRVWDLVDLPHNRKPITCRWVFKTKLDGDGRPHTYKARLVARGFSQKFGEDYDETYAPIVRYDTIRVLLAVSAMKKKYIRQLDVQSAYLNGVLEEEIFMRQPPEFIQMGQENKVCRLRKSLYGLKQSAVTWNRHITEILAKLKFKRSVADPCLYTRIEKNASITYILLYVDDLLVVGENENSTMEIKKQLDNYFEVRDLGEAKHYLGIKIERNQKGDILLSQETKIKQMVQLHELTEAKPAKTPMETGFLSGDTIDSPLLSNSHQYKQVIGSLLYLATVEARYSRCCGFPG